MQYSLIYLLKVCSWFIPLYLLFLFLYKKYTFFNWNRYYLLSIVIASFALPFVHYNLVDQQIVFANFSHTISPFAIKNIYQIEDLNPINSISAKYISNFNWWSIPFLIYLIGVIIVSIKLIKGLLEIRKLIKISQKNWTNNLALVHTNDKMPHSSFFHYIFLNNKTKNGEDIEKIIYHEMQHNEKLHTIDVLFCELLKIILWFNPFVYWYKKSLQEIHEFEVDNEMTKLYNQVIYAELLLKIATTNSNTTLVNPFSTKPLKTRLKMIFNPKTYPMKKVSFLLVIPFITLFLMAYGNINFQKITTFKNKETPITIILDAGHGGYDAGAINGEIKESNMDLILTELVQQKGKELGYNIIMTRTKDEFLDLKTRGNYAAQNKANAFISIHCNTSPVKTDKGFNFFINKSGDSMQLKSSQILGNKIMQKLKTINQIEVNTDALTRNTGIWILNESTKVCPSILIECGYLSNTNDLQFLQNTDNQNLIASKIIDGINTFFKIDKL